MDHVADNTMEEYISCSAIPTRTSTASPQARPRSRSPVHPLPVRPLAPTTIFPPELEIQCEDLGAILQYRFGFLVTHDQSVLEPYAEDLPTMKVAHILALKAGHDMISRDIRPFVDRCISMLAAGQHPMDSIWDISLHYPRGNLCRREGVQFRVNPRHDRSWYELIPLMTHPHDAPWKLLVTS